MTTPSSWRPRASSSGTLRITGLPIPLTGKLGVGKVAWVSPQRWEVALQFTWHLGFSGYPQNSLRTRTQELVRLHEWVCAERGLTRGQGRHIDHINRDKLDARDENLRVVEQWRNAANRDGNRRDLPRGVAWFSPAKLYQAYINAHGRRIALGYSHTIEGAHAKRLAAEDKYYGERLPTNV